MGLDVPGEPVWTAVSGTAVEAEGGLARGIDGFVQAGLSVQRDGTDAHDGPAGIRDRDAQA